jgi:hypothetical protein
LELLRWNRQWAPLSDSNDFGQTIFFELHLRYQQKQQQEGENNKNSNDGQMGSQLMVIFFQSNPYVLMGF